MDLFVKVMGLTKGIKDLESRIVTLNDKNNLNSDEVLELSHLESISDKVKSTAGCTDLDKCYKTMFDRLTRLCYDTFEIEDLIYNEINKS